MRDLNIVYRSGHARAGAIGGLHLALCAVNMAEAAGSAMSNDVRADIYATAAISAKLGLPAPLHFLMVSFTYWLVLYILNK